MKNHMLVTYSEECAANNHIDPNFTYLVYGDSGNNAYRIVKDLTEGSYVFFNINIGGKRYITAYFYIEKILQKGKDDAEIATLQCDAKDDEVIIIGSRNFSKILTAPLVFDKNLAIELTSLHADKNYFDQALSEGRTELSAINSKTKVPRILDEKDKNTLLHLCHNRG